MMRFKIRRIPRSYTNVEVEVGGGKFDLGLLNKAERLELARILKEAIDELTEPGETK